MPTWRGLDAFLMRWAVPQHWRGSHDGSVLCRPDAGPVPDLARDDPDVREDVMQALYVIAGVVAVGLTVYLFVALFYPEKLQ
jgi:K+-transporting ATPase KdpF subunit